MQIKLNKPPKKDGLLVVSDSSDLARLGERKRAKVVLGAPALLSSMEPLPANTNYVLQPPRAVGRTWPWDRTPAKMVYSAVGKEVLSALAKGQHKAVFGVDVAMRYGQKLKGADEHLVLCAFDGAQTTSVLFLLFRKGALAELQSFALPAAQNPDHDTDAHLLLERLRTRHPQAQVHWLGPLAAPRTEQLRTPSGNLWALAPGQALAGSGKPGLWRRFGAAVLVLVLAALGSAGAVYLPYEDYLKARADLSAESQSLQGQFQFASDRLQMLRARQAFFEISAREQRRLQHFETLLARVSEEPGLLVIEAKMSAPAGSEAPGAAPQGESTADFELLVRLPREPDVTALAQSLPLLQHLSTAAGMPMRLATQDGHREMPSAERPMRQYRIQGDFPHAE